MSAKLWRFDALDSWFFRESRQSVSTSRPHGGWSSANLDRRDSTDGLG